MNGPSTVDSLPRRRRTRAPSAVGRSPAVLTSRPLRVISSISLPMSVMSCSLGTWPVFSWMRIIERNRISGSALLRQPGGLGAQALLLLAQLGREFRAEVLALEYLTDLDLGFGARHRVGTALDPVDRLLPRLHLP